MADSVQTIFEPLPPASSSAVLSAGTPSGGAAGVPIYADKRAVSAKTERADNQDSCPNGQHIGAAQEPVRPFSARGKPSLSAPLSMTAAEAARHYRVSLRTVRYWIARRRLRVYQPAGKGGKVLIWMQAF